MTVRILHGDCLDVLRTLPEASVHCCVTSPPYFGLRDYGTASWSGGDPACDHKQEAPRFNGPKQTTAQVSGHASKAERHGRRECQKCGATSTDLQIGLEPTPDDFVAKMVAVFREVRRVLRDDGTLWLNLGDSYAGSWGAQGRQGATGEMATRSVAAAREKSKISAAQIAAHPHRQSNTGSRDGYTVARPHPLRDGEPLLSGGVAAVDSEAARLKAKDLIGIPWRVAFALQADGWYLRQDIIWHKPNPMPESVRDRCTKAHEYVFLLTKSERYYFDADAIAEPAQRPEGAGNVTHKGATAYEAGDEKMRTKVGLTKIGARDTRNKRSVWTVTTQPFREAHFATFPPALIEPCILAGAPRGGVVLDPFGGAGTTGLVADRHGRDAVLIELNPEYAQMASRRIHSDAPLFAEVAA